MVKVTPVEGERNGRKVRVRVMLMQISDIYEAKRAVIQMAKFVLKSLGGKFDILNHNICSGQMHTCGKGAHVATEEKR